MGKKKLKLVADKGKSPISDLSPDEEARALKLADVALHNSPAPHNLLLPGERARTDHLRLMEEVRQAERSQREEVRNELGPRSKAA